MGPVPRTLSVEDCVMRRLVLALVLFASFVGCNHARTHVGVEVNSDGAPTRGIYETQHDEP
jgi:hypothetical protein